MKRFTNALKSVSIFVLIFSAFNGWGQKLNGPTEYLDNGFNKTKRSKAVYVRHLGKYKKTDVRCAFQDYLVTGELYREGYLALRSKTVNPNGPKVVSSTLDSLRVTYYKNGNKRLSGNYTEGRKVGTFRHWYQNGKVRGDYRYFLMSKAGLDQDYIYANHYDSLGHQQISNGNGVYDSFDPDENLFVKGKTEMGLKTGLWTGKDSKGNLRYSEKYEKGNLVKGESYDADGRKYIYTEVKQAPEYEGGRRGFYRAVGKSVRYPREARTSGVAGKVYISYVVDKEGKVTKTRNINSLHPALDKEAIRVISSLNGYSPGMKRGQVSDIEIIFPFSFQAYAVLK
ncbi:hypothetical protein FUAX_06670 [Fulvitalea axinellae]|uniref:TonB C-terminal domain-containing protein n=1 Tax=Fulvitalea axinellae TaxID=1182444 RepID=A0AAU9D7R2_9BACT|nr:hypothetical protein FUAX_06670 [Fulvitalea axinellae]